MPQPKVRYKNTLFKYMPRKKKSIKSRGSALSETEVGMFLRSGALMQWGNNSWIVGWGSPAVRSEPDQRVPSFYANDFTLSRERAWHIYPETHLIKTRELLQQFTESIPNYRRWTDVDERKFRGAFRKSLDLIHSGRIHKVVISSFIRSPGGIQPGELRGIMGSVVRTDRGLTAYGLWGQQGGFIGATPEILFRKNDQGLFAYILAGTALSGEKRRQFESDNKEVLEHQLAAQELQRAFHVIGDVNLLATRSWKVGGLLHLRSDFALRPQAEYSFQALTEHLHPTAALGTAPQRKWRRVLQRVENEDRGSFGSPFGVVLPDGRARCVVSIRCVQWDGAEARIGAGCGIVKCADFAEELSEVRAKIKTAKSNLGFFVPQGSMTRQ